MPTIEDIEYDTDKLGNMTDNELLQQIVFRQDLFFPKRAALVSSSEFAAETVSKLKVLLAALPEEVPTIKAEFAASIAEYEAGL